MMIREWPGWARATMPGEDQNREHQQSGYLSITAKQSAGEDLRRAARKIERPSPPGQTPRGRCRERRRRWCP